MGKEPGSPSRRARFDRTTWIAFVVVLVVGLAGIAFVAVRVVESDGDRGATVEGALPSGHVHGRVTVGGEPREGVDVVASRVLPDGSRETPLNGIRTTTQDGGFVLNGLEPGTYEVSVSAGLPVLAGDFVPLRVAGREFGEVAEIELPADHGVGGVELDLLPAATMGGRAVTRGGAPASSLPVRVELLDDAGEPTGLHAQAVTDPAGRWQVDGLPPGEFRVSSSDAYDDPPPTRTVGSGRGWEQAYQLDVSSVQDDRHRTLRRPVRVAEGATVAASDLLLRRTTTLRGTVRDADGDPVRGVDVVLHVPVTTRWIAGPSAVTDRRGRYELVGIRPGTYRLGVDGHLTGFLGGARTVEDSEPVVVRRRGGVQRGLDLVVR